MSSFAQFKVAAENLRMAVKAGLDSRRWAFRPQAVNFEITAACDARCIHCPRNRMDRPMKPMAFELFKKMVDEAAALKVPELIPNGYGELLMLPELSKYLEYISAQSHKFRISINTNGNRMFDDKIELFFKHNIYLLNIIIDGATKETAESIRINLSTEQIERNIHRLLALRRERNLKFPKIRVGMVVLPQNEHEVQQFIDKWTGVADYVGMSGFSNRLGGVSAPALHPGEMVQTCVLPFKELNIWADGKVVLCCQDWNEEHVVGDLNTESLLAIWQGALLKHARKLHRQGQGCELAICNKCNSWRKPTPGLHLWE